MTKGAAGKSNQQPKTLGSDKKSASGDRSTKRDSISGCFISHSSVPARKVTAVKRAVASSLVVPANGTFHGVTQEHLDRAIAKVRRMTRAQRIQSLIDCGVLTPARQLAGHYQG